jgi:hypothetical protein
MGLWAYRNPASLSQRGGGGGTQAPWGGAWRHFLMLCNMCNIKKSRRSLPRG